MKLLTYCIDRFYGKKEITTTRIVLFSAVFFVAFDNYKFFQNVLGVYPLNTHNIGFLISLAIGLASVIVLLLSLFSSRYTTKTLLIILFIVTSFTTYFLDNYNVVIDDIMIQNVVETSWSETSDLLSIKLLYYFLFLGVLPSIFVYRVKITSYPLKKSFVYKLRDSIISIIIIFVMILAFSKFYTSFFRENKPLRYYTNPTYYIYSVGKYLNKTFNTHKTTVASLGLDAKVVNSARKGVDDHPELVIVVVGEAARADHFSLNGYMRETNPYLQHENIINFSNMYSCGTSTSYSVPCMFSVLPRSKFNSKKGAETENVLDVLRHTGLIDILWRDNNSDSKGVALRIPYEDYKSPKNNTMCADGECRDEGMLVGLDEYIARHQGRDILIVLHQMGNHGPAYYKRYPTGFKKFTPECMTNQIEECMNEEIVNAYDNAILYTDYFLANVVNFLKKYDATHETAMMYFSDHGESLGENGVYLHGLPYMMAPEAQKHIASLVWFGEKTRDTSNLDVVVQRKDRELSQDYLSHTLLGLFEVTTEVYDKDLDLLQK